MSGLNPLVAISIVALGRLLILFMRLDALTGCADDWKLFSFAFGFGGCFVASGFKGVRGSLGRIVAGGFVCVGVRWR